MIQNKHKFMFAVTFTNVRSPRTQKRLALATGYIMKLLKVPHQLQRHMLINIKFNKKMVDVADGWCEVVEHNRNGKPREFCIEINSQQDERMIFMTLAHELVHVKQFATGEINEQLTKWCGKRIPPSTEYWDQPWEIEAHGREKGLYVRLCQNVLTDLDPNPYYTERPTSHVA
jgi:hypothetical protein